MKKQTRHQYFPKGGEGKGNELTSETQFENKSYLYHRVGLRNKRDNNKLLEYLWNIYKFSYISKFTSKRANYANILIK